MVGRYRLVSEQGAGLFGAVWLAEDTVSGQPVALRLLPRELTDTANVAETVRRRSRAIVEASRAHPGLVRVLEYGATGDGTLYAVMERVEGQRLSQVLADRSRPDVPGSLRLAVEMGGPVETLHNMGLLHGALWPRNFAVADGRVTLMDVETIALRDAAALQPLVAARGPEAYLAPEQIQGRPITEKTDVYAFTATLYEMVAGRPPFEGPTREAVLDKHLNAAPPALRRSRRTVPASIEVTLMEGLEKRPEARPFMPMVLNHIATEAGSGTSRRWKRFAALIAVSAGLGVAVAIALPLAWSVLAPRWSSLTTPSSPTQPAPATPSSPPAAETKPEPPAAAEKRAEPTPADPLPAAPAPAVPPPGPSVQPPAATAAPPPPPPSVSMPVAPVPPPASVVQPPAPKAPAAPPASVAAPAPPQLPAPPASTVTPPPSPRPSAPPTSAPATPVAPPAPPAVARPAPPRPATPATPAPQAERPRAAAPAPLRPAPATREEPDPSAVIDWLLKRNSD
jgi:serine/threonine-protein kinase